LDDLEIAAEPTPNPDAMKFSLNRTVTEGARGRTFSSPEEAVLSPLARALLGVQGVRSVFMLRDFVTVTRVPDAVWDPIVEGVERALREYFRAG
jgi:hypothetical protein